MGFRTGSYAKVWHCEKGKGSYYVAEMSVSKKNKESGKYETEWADKYVHLVGDAARAAESFTDGQSVRIGDCDVQNRYDKAKGILYTNYSIFSFLPNDDSPRASAPKKDEYITYPEGMDKELPFT